MEHAVQVSWEEEMIDWSLLPADDTYPEYAEHRDRDLPPGQTLAKRFPHLEYAEIPRDVSHTDWKVECFGEVERRTFWAPDNINSLSESRRQDFNCITGWSLFDTEWNGLPGHVIAKCVRPADSVTTVMIHGLDEFTTSVWIEDFCNGMLAIGYKGRKLSAEHGYPVRFVAPPHLYQFKSCKWVTGLEFLTEHKLGFWEIRAYSDSALVENNDRYTNPIAQKGKSYGRVRSDVLREDRSRGTIEESICPYAS